MSSESSPCPTQDRTPAKPGPLSGQGNKNCCASGSPQRRRETQVKAGMTDRPSRFSGHLHTSVDKPESCAGAPVPTQQGAISSSAPRPAASGARTQRAGSSRPAQRCRGSRSPSHAQRRRQHLFAGVAQTDVSSAAAAPAEASAGGTRGSAEPWSTVVPAEPRAGRSGGSGRTRRSAPCKAL